jgi:nickel-type superoxide dismutase maturation protease
VFLQLMKVSGNSLWPLYQDGDYVLAAHPALAGNIKPGDIIVFRHPGYNTMIKQVERVLADSGEIFVIGTHDRSVDSRQFGAISRRSVLGKVIWHIKRT